MTPDSTRFAADNSKKDHIMKINKIIGGLMAAVAVLATQAAHAALTFADPITLNSPGVVGQATGITGGGPGTESTMTTIAQTLLNMAAGSTQSLNIGSGSTLKTSSTEYAGTITSAFGGGTVNIPLGYQFVIGKYDGPQGGYILFYLGGQDATIPNLPWSIFGNQNDQGFALSGWYAFNATDVIAPVPEPATVVAGALLLLPLGASAVRILRKNRTA
jgi:hypothetical protein